MRLEGRSVIVTGAERGIGRAIAIGLARDGADVAVLHYPPRAEQADETIQAIQDTGRRAVAIPIDISDPVAVEKSTQEAFAQFGWVSGLVNNASILFRQPLFEINFEDFSRVIDTNLKGTFMVSQATARHMVDHQKGGSIINVTSISAERAAPGLVHYQAAKAGVQMLTRGMALELAPYGIRVNAIAPGLTITDLNRDLMSDPDVRAERVSAVPLGRAGEPSDHVGAAVYLASDEAGWVTGTTITVDGGITVR